jgi:hypothetical protein
LINKLSVQQEDLVRTQDQLLQRCVHIQNPDLPRQKEFQRKEQNRDLLPQRDVLEVSHLPEKTRDPDPEVLNETEEIPDHAHDPLVEKKLSFTSETSLMILLSER